MPFRNPFQWAATRYLRNHILHAIEKPQAKARRPKASVSFSSIGMVSSNAGLADQMTQYMNMECARLNLMIHYLAEGNMVFAHYVDQSIDVLVNLYWPENVRNEWMTRITSNEASNFEFYEANLKMASQHALWTLSEKKGFKNGSVVANISVSYDKDTTVMKIEEYGIEHKLADFSQDGLPQQMLALVARIKGRQ